MRNLNWPRWTSRTARRPRPTDYHEAGTISPSFRRGSAGRESRDRPAAIRPARGVPPGDPLAGRDSVRSLPRHGVARLMFHRTGSAGFVVLGCSSRPALARLFVARRIVGGDSLEKTGFPAGGGDHFTQPGTPMAAFRGGISGTPPRRPTPPSPALRRHPHPAWLHHDHRGDHPRAAGAWVSLPPAPLDLVHSHTLLSMDRRRRNLPRSRKPSLCFIPPPGNHEIHS